MSRVLISYFSADDVDVMYDSIAKELVKNNNNVLKFNISGIVASSFSADSSHLDNSYYIRQIKNFNPDLILSFNNSFPVNLIKDLDCEIFVLDADNPNFFWNKDFLIQNKEKIRYIGMMSTSKVIYENFLGRKLKSEEFLYLPPATIMNSYNIPKKNNISFIGTNFYPSILEYGFHEVMNINAKLINDIYIDLQTNYLCGAQKLYEQKYKRYDIFDNYEKFRRMQNFIDRLYTGQNRLEYLSALSDLGLKIYGVAWEHTFNYNLSLISSFSKKKILSIKDNEDVYNSSKISINISHPQATEAFSWRVSDIMASSSCLVIENKPDWHDLFGKFISSKVKDAIIYEGRFDMRDKCIKLLENETLRRQCVEECNNAIENNGRWTSRLKLIEDFCLNTLEKHNLTLVNVINASNMGKKAQVSSKKFLDLRTLDKHSLPLTKSPKTLDKYSLPLKETILVKSDILSKIKKIISKLSLYARVINIVSYLILVLGQIPILDRLLVNRSVRRFLYKIISNNRR